MTIQARVVDIETGNTYFTRNFRNTDEAQAFADEHNDTETVVKFKIIQH